MACLLYAIGAGFLLARAASALHADKIFLNATFIISLGDKRGSTSSDHVRRSTCASSRHVVTATALAASNGRVVYHGDAEDTLRLFSGPKTGIVDLQGSFVVPGLIDSHVHFIDGGMQLTSLSLRGVSSPRELRDSVRGAAEALAPGDWLLGHGWNEHKWGPAAASAFWEELRSSGARSDQEQGNAGTPRAGTCSRSSQRTPTPRAPGASADSSSSPSSPGPSSRDRGSAVEGQGHTAKPHRAWIDDVTPNNPVLLMRVDGHVALANAAALSAAAVTDSTPDPTNGVLGRDPGGSLSGILLEGAIGLVSGRVPLPSRDRRRQALLLAQAEALSRGITAVVDLGNYYPGSADSASWDDLENVYMWADEAGKMAMRVHAVLPLTAWHRLQTWMERRGTGSSTFLRWGLLKAFADGSVGSRTALFHEPYADAATCGVPLGDPSWLARTVADVGRSAQPMGVAVHAIGDAAVSRVLGAFAEALDLLDQSSDACLGSNTTELQQEGQSTKRWWRIEHAQHVRSLDLLKFEDLGVVASMQPYHLADDVAVLGGALGGERATSTSFRFESLRRHCPAFALGSDWPVVTLDPFEGLLAAGHWRADLQEWSLRNDGESLDPVEGLRGYTEGAALASRWAHDIGSLEVGKLVDMVVVDENPLDVLPQGRKPVVLCTIVAGQVRFTLTQHRG